jgi:hypothetical protein
MRRRVFPDQGHHLAQIDDAFAVQGHGINSGTTGWRQAWQVCVIIVPGEMFVPIVTAWVIKRNGFSGGGIEREDFIVLAAVAALTGQCQIIFGIASPLGHSLHKSEHCATQVSEKSSLFTYSFLRGVGQ